MMNLRGTATLRGRAGRVERRDGLSIEWIVPVTPSRPLKLRQGECHRDRASRSEAQAITGNAIAVLEVTQDEARTKLSGNAQLWRALARDGIAVHGLTTNEFPERVHA